VTSPLALPTIRPALAADIPAMQRVRTAVRENRLSDPARIGPEEYARRLAPGVSSRGWVADVPGSGVVGFSFVDAVDGNVWALFVAPEAERRGIGRALHDVAMRWLFDTGCPVAWLTTAPGTRALGFYQAAGWRVIGLAGGELRLELEETAWRRGDGH
jgi:GNAT superfamily N-acetyltransferase